MNKNLLVDKVSSMINGKSVILSDESLDYLCTTVGSQIRSYANPARVGILDAWVCWIGKFEPLEVVMSRLER